MSRDGIGAGGVMVESPTDFGAGPSMTNSPATLAAPNSLGGRMGRRTSKSVSGARPPLSTSASSHRTLGYGNQYTPEAGPSTTGPSGSSPILGPTRVRNGLKRRISTPNLMKGRSLVPEEDDGGEPDHGHGATTPNGPGGLQAKGGGKVVETRARSTSTSIVVPQSLATEPESPTFAEEPVTIAVPPQATVALPTPPWSGMYVTPPSPPSTARPREYEPDAPGTASGATGLLTSAYEMGETFVTRMLSWAHPQRERRSRRRSHASDDDSEKGLNGSEAGDDFDEKDEGETFVRPSSSRGWRLFTGPRTPDSASYFELPPTPPDDRACDPMGFPASLPTPALSTQSLSHGSRRLRRASRAAALKEAQADGWWVKVYRTVSFNGSGKTAQVLRELGWTVALLAALFVVSFLLVLYALSSMPITHLKSMPKSTTDLQLLSADMRAYMASGDAGWWHTVGVLTYIGCWKHAWSVPGAVVLNILVGSIFDPIAALALLTVITACGSLGAYMLSRPLAPLIGVLFPKPLALVRAALAPQSVPKPSNVPSIAGETVTPVRVSNNPRDAALGAPEDRPNVWRRLLLMRAMGFVPWSGMNVACGVVGVDWRTFWLTTAAGSASWSYVTASVGNILSRLALPTADGAEVQGESLTSLLRDPTLIAKLVFLTLLTLVPVLLKRRVSPSDDDTDDDASDPPTPTTPPAHSALGLDTTGLNLSINTNLEGQEYPSEPASPLAISLASFTPTPHVFDLLSFGRSALRQGVRVVVGGARSATTTAQRIFGRQ